MNLIDLCHASLLETLSAIPVHGMNSSIPMGKEDIVTHAVLIRRNAGKMKEIVILTQSAMDH